MAEWQGFYSSVELVILLIPLLQSVFEFSQLTG